MLNHPKRRGWYPEGLKLLQGKGNIGKEGMHVLTEKTIAEVCEALIGASILSGGQEQHFDMYGCSSSYHLCQPQ